MKKNMKKNIQESLDEKEREKNFHGNSKKKLKRQHIFTEKKMIKRYKNKNFYGRKK